MCMQASGPLALMCSQVGPPNTGTECSQRGMPVLQTLSYCAVLPTLCATLLHGAAICVPWLLGMHIMGLSDLLSVMQLCWAA